MNRIYKSEITKDYTIRTTFFNGEIRELKLEVYCDTPDEYKRLISYLKNGTELLVNSNKTRLELAEGVSIDNDTLYNMGNLVGVEYIDDINIQIATNFQSLREAVNLTQGDIEKLTGIHQAEISKIERGIGNPSITTLNRLALAINRRISIKFEDRNIRADVMENLLVAPYLKVGKRQGEYCIEDLYNLPDDIRVELIEGCIYDLAQPSILHQEISMFMSHQIYDYIKNNNGGCNVYATVAVTFENSTRDYLVPDLIIVCDKEKVCGDKILGAPDFVLEIASPSNCRLDYGIKQKIYMENGVREYWILDPSKKALVVYHYEKNYVPCVHHFDETVGIGIYDGDVKIDLREIMKMIEK